ncbi:hypothetical protein BJX63DRAFT_209128 [Aspergillus granulosus]|uniref:LysM domain-containing protein n=1 Tax=Aspergillus granulosus TaxID=176169 RepID=A0ABR4HEJ4_9EURO
MPRAELCTYCFTTMFQMRQASPYAPYTEQYKSDLEYILATCGLMGPTDLHPPLFLQDPEPPATCLSGKSHVITSGETCDIIALHHGVSSAAIHSGNSEPIYSCSDLVVGRELCIPLLCEINYQVEDGDTCYYIEVAHNLDLNTLRRYNTWIDPYCTNLHSVREVQGSVICLSPQGGTHNSTSGGKGRFTSDRKANGGYSYYIIDPPPTGATLAEGTTKWCGQWYTASDGDRCSIITVQNGITADLLLKVNPSLSRTDCDASLVERLAYCVALHLFWDDPGLEKSMTESSVLTEDELIALRFL